MRASRAPSDPPSSTLTSAEFDASGSAISTTALPAMVPNESRQDCMAAARSARGVSRRFTTSARGTSSAAHSSHSASVVSSGGSAAETTNSAASAARSPARSSPTKSPNPGVSSRVTTASFHDSGHADRNTDRCWAASTGSLSDVVVPSSTEPGRPIAPATASRCSTRVVLPTPLCPTTATLRTSAGRVAGATGARACWPRGDGPPADGRVAVAGLLNAPHHLVSSARRSHPLACKAFDTRCR